MAHHTEQAGFPAIPLKPGMKIVLEAIDPDTGAEVTGVVSSEWSIYGYDDSPGLNEPDTVPHWVSQSEGSG